MSASVHAFLVRRAIGRTRATARPNRKKIGSAHTFVRGHWLSGADSHGPWETIEYGDGMDSIRSDSGGVPTATVLVDVSVGRTWIDYSPGFPISTRKMVESTRSGGAGRCQHPHLHPAR